MGAERQQVNADGSGFGCLPLSIILLVFSGRRLPDLFECSLGRTIKLFSRETRLPYHAFDKFFPKFANGRVYCYYTSLAIFSRDSLEMLM
jgi:hypothetical protein